MELSKGGAWDSQAYDNCTEAPTPTNVSPAISVGISGATAQTILPTVAMALPVMKNHLRPKMSVKRPTMIRPIELVSK